MRPRRRGAINRAPTLYRRWYAAAGPWEGFFRAVPLVALARGFAPNLPDAGGVRDGRARGDDGAAAVGARSIASLLAAAGQAEGWLGRPDVLLLLDLPAATGVAVAAELASHGVRPVLLLLLWPEPEALLPAGDLLASLLERVPPRPSSGPTQYAFVLARERDSAATAMDLAVRFDNRYELGAVDLPSPERLHQGGAVAVVACRLASAPPAPDLVAYLAVLEAAALPVRRLVLSDE